MRIIVISLVLYVLGACDNANTEEVVEFSGMSYEVVDSIIKENELADEDISIELEKEWWEPDSVELLLEKDIAEFMTFLKQENFEAAQKLLHKDGVYFYTCGKIPKNEFNFVGLWNHEGILDGAYSYGLSDFEESDSMVSGMFWLASLRSDFTETRPKWHSSYSAMGYGFTGNYSSDHIDLDIMFEESETAHGHIAYIDHDDPEITAYEVLMIEFCQDENDDWKIYAIGNLEWTP